MADAPGAARISAPSGTCQKLRAASISACCASLSGRAGQSFAGVGGSSQGRVGGLGQALGLGEVIGYRTVVAAGGVVAAGELEVGSSPVARPGRVSGQAGFADIVEAAGGKPHPCLGGFLAGLKQPVLA